MKKVIERHREPVVCKFSLREFRERLGITEKSTVVRAWDIFGDVEVVMAPEGDSKPVYHYTRSEFLENLGLPQVNWFSVFPYPTLFGHCVQVTYFEPEVCES